MASDGGKNNIQRIQEILMNISLILHCSERSTAAGDSPVKKLLNTDDVIKNQHQLTADHVVRKQQIRLARRRRG